MSTRTTLHHLHIGWFGLVIVVCGCASPATRKTATIRSLEHVKTSAPELSARNQSLLGLYSTEIEAAADNIILQSPAAVTRRQALLWKTEAIPVLQRALLNTDPLAASLDTWAFLFQMTGFMEQPAVKQAFEEFHPGVLETLGRMNLEMEQLIQAAAPKANVEAARKRVQAWAEAHPIEAGLSGRKSADAELILRAEQVDLGTRASIKALGESIGDLTARLDSYNAFLPKQARWQAELLLSDAGHDPQVSAALSHLGVLSNTLEKVSGSVDQMPNVMHQVGSAALQGVEGQRLGAQAFFRQERLETLNALKQERMAATADLRRERKIVLDTFHDERLAATGDLRAATEAAVVQFDAKARGLIDHFFLRLLELLLVSALLFSLAGWFLVRQFTRRRWDRGRRYDRAA